MAVPNDVTRILLVGSHAPLLEGLAQAFAASGHAPRVALSLAEARDDAFARPPLVAVVERAIAAEASGEALGIALAPGGALVLFRGVGDPGDPLPSALQRQVLADLSLPRERNRLVALVQHVRERATAAGRGRRDDPGERLSI
jgi:hypothetical protein